MKDKDRRQAAKLALDALRRRRQDIAFDANMFKKYGYETELTVRRAAQYDELTAEIARIEADLAALVSPKEGAPGSVGIPAAPVVQGRLF